SSRRACIAPAGSVLAAAGSRQGLLRQALRQRRTRQANAGSPRMPSPVSSAVLEQRADQPASPPARELDRSLIRGIAWTGATRWATQLLGWASKLIVARLTRDLDFRRLAWADGAEALVAAGATLAFAAVGLRSWALVLGPLAGRLTSTVLINAWRSHRLAWPRRFASIAAAVSFGWQVV